jgi:hypothetical protein
MDKGQGATDNRKRNTDRDTKAYSTLTLTGAMTLAGTRTLTGTRKLTWIRAGTGTLTGTGTPTGTRTTDMDIDIDMGSFNRQLTNNKSVENVKLKKL